MILRMAIPNDIYGIINLCNLVFRQPPDPPNMGDNFPYLLSPGNADNLIIAEDNGKIVAHYGTKLTTIYINGHAIKYASVGAVCTHPDYRGKGIATSLQSMALKHLAAQDVPIVTISGARGLYTSNGATHTGSAFTYNIDPSMISHQTICDDMVFSVMEGGKNTELLASVYHKETVRYNRTVREFPVLIEVLPMVHDDRKAITLTAFKNDNVVAYLSGYKDDNNTFRVIEYSGMRFIIMELIHRTARIDNIELVDIKIPYYHTLLICMLHESGQFSEEIYMPGTIRLVDSNLLWDSLLPIYDEFHIGPRMPRRWQDLDLSNVPGINDEIRLLRYAFTQKDRTWKGTPIPLPWPNGYNYI